MNTKPTYLSKEGLDKLRTELDEMTSVKRPEVAQRIHDAKEHGDLSENAEYEDAKNEQAFVEGRIQTLQALIKNATIIDEHHSTDHVQIGSTVKVASDDGEESFTIVGSTEAKPTEGRISNESPVGRALLGKKKGEKVVVKVPAGDFTYKVVSISLARFGPRGPRADGPRRIANHGLGGRARRQRQRTAGRQRLQDAIGDGPRRLAPGPGHPRRDRPGAASRRDRDHPPVRHR
jgi:transcription elongation factor GreA